MHPALNIVTFGLLSLYLQRKEAKRAEKRTREAIETKRRIQAAKERLMASAECKRLDANAEAKCIVAEAERKRLAAIATIAEVKRIEAEVERIADAKRQLLEKEEAVKQAAELEFSKDPLAYIKIHYSMLNNVISNGVASYTHNFGNWNWTESVIPEHMRTVFGYSWKADAVQSLALCMEMDDYISNYLLDSNVVYSALM